MPQSFSAMYAHLVFSTKNRQPFLRDAVLRAEVHSYLGGVSAKLECPTLVVGGVEDHVHVLARLGGGITQREWVKEVKRVSSTWIKTQSPHLADFYWQSGCGLFSVSMSNIERVRSYVLGQEARHRKESFQDEYRALLRKHNLEWDERYVWD
ncbi:MAG: transposase [Candidatus Sumerlaeia bacterium]|nr:transposase [Candidatus Sumerlaeia bacterium]